MTAFGAGVSDCDLHVTYTDPVSGGQALIADLRHGGKGVGHGRASAYGFVIIESRCIDCRACLVACTAENEVPLGKHRNWVETDGPTACSPTWACATSSRQLHALRDPVVPRSARPARRTSARTGSCVIDYDDCIGCRYCIDACPYHARFRNAQTGDADKCTFCVPRIDAGRPPACVETCIGGSRLFGDLNDPDSEVSRSAGRERRARAS